jgi:hypothetical protein
MFSHSMHAGIALYSARPGATIMVLRDGSLGIAVPVGDQEDGGCEKDEQGAHASHKRKHMSSAFEEQDVKCNSREDGNDKLAEAMRTASHTNRRFHTTVRWLCRLHDAFYNATLDESFIFQLRTEFYLCVSADSLLPRAERRLDLTMQRANEGSNTLVALDVMLEHDHTTRSPVSSSTSSPFQLRPRQVADYWAREAPRARRCS